MRIFCFYLLVLLVASCVPPEEKNALDIDIDLTLENQQAIFNAKDEGNAELLKSFFGSEDITERYLAALSSSSLKDTVLCPGLLDLLYQDPSEEIRTVAAYALGQIGSAHIINDLTEAFAFQDTSTYNSPVRGAILEAVGKCGDERSLNFLATISTYQPEDNHLLLGQARAIYRFGLRQMISDEGTSTMAGVLLNTSISDEVRLIAAHYFLRNPDADVTNFSSRLMSLLVAEKNPEIRMALAGAMTARANPDHIPVFLSMMASDPDDRVRMNIMRSLSAYDYNLYRDSLYNHLEDSNDQLFHLASDHFMVHLATRDHNDFLLRARSETDILKKAKLYSVALNALPSGFINTRRAISAEITETLQQSGNYLEQAAMIQALSYDPLNLDIIRQEGLQSSNNFVRTTAIQSMRNLLTNKRSLAVFSRPSAMNNFRNTITTYLGEVLDTGDAGSVAGISNLVRDESLGFKDQVGLNLSIRRAMRKLTLPTDLEARQECLITLGYLEDTTFTIDPPAYNHPIDWSAIADISDSSRAYIITTKGQIELQLFKNQAPGSVANFMKLAQDNYYDGKTIHRVVPNFVIQGGCPRGDGYGSLDYTIRSDFGPMYYNAAGYLGMASAGPNTEGTQWFITHSPTPHLDGRYSIFGKVTAGMDVVDAIRQGDVIQDIRILKF